MLAQNEDNFVIAIQQPCILDSEVFSRWYKTMAFSKANNEGVENDVFNVALKCLSNFMVTT